MVVVVVIGVKEMMTTLPERRWWWPEGKKIQELNTRAIPAGGLSRAAFAATTKQLNIATNIGCSIIYFTRVRSPVHPPEYCSSIVGTRRDLQTVLHKRSKDVTAAAAKRGCAGTPSLGARPRYQRQ